MSSNDSVSPTPSKVSLIHRIAFYCMLGIWVLYAIFIAGIAMNDRAGRGMAVSMSVMGAMVALTVTYVWLLFFTASNSIFRWTLFALPVVGVLLAMLIRVEGVTGSLVPKLRFVWDEAPDEKLDTLIGEHRFETGIDLETTSEYDFPQFLGPHRDASIDGVRIATNWDQNPPNEKWRIPIGAGWCSFAAVNGYAVTMEQRGTQESTTCYAIETGELVWGHSIDTRHSTVMGGVGPRATPTIHQGRVYAVGATGILRCLDGSNGQLIWQRNLIESGGADVERDGEAIAWGRSGSPLIVDDMVVVPAGGARSSSTTTLIAFGLESGGERWRVGSHQISYASPMLATLDGERQICYVAQDFVCGFDPISGVQLWQHAWPGASTSNASVSQPLVIGGNRLFLSKGYTHGAELIEVTKNDAHEGWNVESVWAKHNVMKTKFSNVAFLNGFVYGLDDVILECLDANTGRKIWKKGRYGYGQILRVSDVLLVQAESGDLVAVAAKPEFQELSRAPALKHKTWNTLCLYHHRLLLRNDREAVCFELTLR